jgi:hypothetical protein
VADREDETDSAAELQTDRRSRGRSSYAALSDRALLDAMRTRDVAAIEEFIRRFQHLALVHAKRLRVPPDERRHWVAEVLYEVALVLCRRESPVPHALGPYLVTAFRRKTFAAHRQRVVRERLQTAASDEVGGAGQRALLGACSEASVRATYGPAWEPALLPPVLERLVAMLEQAVSVDERELLSWVGRRVSYSTIAEWLGITRSAAVKRVTRLRARLVEAAMRFGGSLEREDRAELVRFLRRTGAFEEAELLALASMQDMRGGRAPSRRVARRDNEEEP